MASSAHRSRLSAVSPCRGKRATPMLAVTRVSRPQMSLETRTASETLDARAAASAASLTFSNRMTN